MFHEIVLLMLLVVLVLMSYPSLSTRQAARQGRAVSSISIQSLLTHSIRWHYLNERHLIEETPSALPLRIEAYHPVYEEKHIGVQCDVVSEVICFLEADYNILFPKSQEPSALFIYPEALSLLPIYMLEVGIVFECIYRQRYVSMRLVYAFQSQLHTGIKNSAAALLNSYDVACVSVIGFLEANYNMQITKSQPI